MSILNKRFNRYYILSIICVLVLSYYPLSMGVRVISDIISDGTVMKENYPKYIIPYTPLCMAIIAGVLLMPLLIKLFKKYAFGCGCAVSTGVFFVLEFLFEKKIIVTTAESVVKLEDWQMYMCIVTPYTYETTYKTQTAAEILAGEYTPAFKLHFYIISVVLILTILNALYGYAQMIRSGDKTRFKSLVCQSVCSIVFLGLCILACFTAFWRDGNIQVSPLSAILMIVFFVILGMTVGVFVGSFFLGKRRSVSVLIPSVISSLMTLLMYIGEMILLGGRLYCFGTGLFFDSIPGIVLAPVDVLTVLVSGCITAVISVLLNRKK